MDGDKTMKENYIEYGGFVKDLDTKEYVLLFCTTSSELLCIGRAKENAENYNRYYDKNYDTNDIVVRKRKCILEKADWEEINE